MSPWTICTGPNYASSVTIRMYIFSLVYLCLLTTELGNSIKLSVVLQECCKMPLKYFFYKTTRLPSRFIVTAPVAYVNPSTIPCFVQLKLSTMHLLHRVRAACRIGLQDWAFIWFLVWCVGLGCLPNTNPVACSHSVLHWTRKKEGSFLPPLILVFTGSFPLLTLCNVNASRHYRLLSVISFNSTDPLLKFNHSF